MKWLRRLWPSDASESRLAASSPSIGAQRMTILRASNDPEAPADAHKEPPAPQAPEAEPVTAGPKIRFAEDLAPVLKPPAKKAKKGKKAAETPEREAESEVKAKKAAKKGRRVAVVDDDLDADAELDWNVGAADDAEAAGGDDGTDE